jgi:hypothetical protein
MNKTNKYEQHQIDEIAIWKADEPGVVSKAFGFVLEPMAWLVRKVVPESAIRGVLSMSNGAAQWVTDTNDVMRDGGVTSIAELRSKDLELSDRLANEVHNWAVGFAVAEGGGTGYVGLPGMAIDIPVLITFALRTIHKIGVCYGYEAQSEADEKFVLGILAASGANSIEEKVAALTALRQIEVILAKLTWKKITEKAAEQQISKEAAVLTIKGLAKQLGINITKRKALASIPIIGAVVGASVNGWYIKEVGWAARRMFQERWLIENGKFD